MSGVRVVVVSNLNYFAHLLLAPTVRDPAIEIVGVVEVQGDYQGRRGLSILGEHYRKTGLRFTATKVAWSLLGTAALRRAPHRDIMQALSGDRCPRLAVATVEQPSVVGLLRETQPDVLLSVNCPQRIDESLLGHARVGGVNVHGSLLPAGAGLAPYVWALSEGEQETGITVHEMRQAFDSGRILWQHREAVQPGMSAFDLYRRLAAAAGEAIPGVLKRAAHEGFGWGREQDATLRSYHSLPTRESIRTLRRRGHTLTRVSDIVQLLSAADAR